MRLRPVEGALGQPQQVARAARLGEVGHAGRQGEALAARERLVAHGLAGAVGGLPGVEGVAARQQPRELLAADAREEPVGAGLAGEARGDLGQDVVAHLVAVAGVDVGEAVEVEQRERQRVALGARPVDLVPQAFVKDAVVGEAGEGVGGRAHLGLGEVLQGAPVQPCVGQRQLGDARQAARGHAVAGA